MTDPTGAEIDDLPLLRALSTEVRRDLLAFSAVHGVAPGTVLFRQGEMPNFLHVVLSGAALLFGRSAEGREVLIEAVGPSELIIPAAVVAAAPYLVEARVPTPSRFLMIHAAAVRRVLASDPALGQQIIVSLADQFRRMVRQVKNLKLRSATSRVGCYILALAERQGTPGQAILPYEKTLIASELGMTRESLSRVLSALQQAGIEVNEGTILIRDRSRLAAACAPDLLIDGPDGPVPPSEGV